jgi:DNA-binding SARP family transcriptional activator
MAIYPIVKSKLIPPELPDTLVLSDTVSALQHQMRKSRLAEIYAPAGYGKTTLALSFFKQQKKHNIKCYWYRLESEDAVLGIFYSHLAALLFTSEQAAEINTHIVSAGNIIEESAFINAMICQELSEKKDKRLLVLDDFHYTDSCPAIQETVRYFCDNFPPDFSIVLCSRTKSGFLDGKTSFNHPVCLISHDDLCFSQRETAALAEKVCTVPIQPGFISHIQRITEGWISGIVLYLQAVNACGRDEAVALPDGAAKKDIFEYFFHEIFKSLDDDFRTFLLNASLLREFTAGDITAIFCTVDADRHIRLCVKKGMYLQSIQQRGINTVYRFHSLFRETIDQLRPRYYTPAENKALCLKASGYFIDKGAFDLAVDILISGGEKEKAISLLEKEGQNLLNTGRVEQVRSWLGKLEKRDITDNPYLCYFYGYTYQNVDMDEAVQYLYRAADGFALMKNYGMQARALITIATIYSLKNDVEKVKAVSAKIPILNAFISDRWARKTLLVSTLTQAAWDDRLRAGRLLIRLIQNLRLEDDWKWAYYAYSCMIYYRLGDLDRAESIIGKALDLDLLKNNEIYRGYGLTLLHTVLYLRNDESKGPAVRKELIDIGVKYNSDYFLAYGKRASAFLRYFSHDLQTAVELLDESMDHFKEIGNEAMVCLSTLDRSLWLSGSVNAEGLLRDAKDAYSKLSVLKAGQGLAETGQSVLGAVAALAEEPQYALEALKASARISKGKHADQVLCGTYLHLGHSYLLLGDEARAKRVIAKALNMASAHHYVVFWDMHFTVLLRCLVFAISNNICVDYAYAMVERYFGEQCVSTVRRTISGCSLSEISPYVQTLVDQFGSYSPPQSTIVSIHALGPFTITVNKTRLREDEWKTKKVLGIVKYLVLHYDKPVPREVLMGVFWPDSDPKAASASLRSALYELRKVLSRYGLNQEGACPLVTENRSGLCIRHGGHIMIDLAEVQYICNTLRQDNIGDDRRTALFDRFFSIYRGDLMADDLYADWLNIDRQNYKNIFASHSLAYARILEAGGQYDKAAQILRNLIEKEPLYEEAYYRLICLYLETGETDKAHVLYNSYKNVMRQSLDAGLDDRITSLFA